MNFFNTAQIQMLNMMTRSLMIIVDANIILLVHYGVIPYHSKILNPIVLTSSRQIISFVEGIKLLHPTEVLLLDSVYVCKNHGQIMFSAVMLHRLNLARQE
jgi:hypothetical protein